MNDIFMRAAYGFVASVVFLASLSCARKIDPSINAMNTGYCDTTPMKPYGRGVEIPEGKRRTNYGALTGAVVQAETGDAIEGAVVDLLMVDRPASPGRIFRYTNAKGGFGFDSLEPGTYRARVRRVGEQMDTARIRLAADRVDTLRVRLRAYRCYGY